MNIIKILKKNIPSSFPANSLSTLKNNNLYDFVEGFYNTDFKIFRMMQAANIDNDNKVSRELPGMPGRVITVQTHFSPAPELQSHHNNRWQPGGEAFEINNDSSQEMWRRKYIHFRMQQMEVRAERNH